MRNILIGLLLCMLLVGMVSANGNITGLTHTVGSSFIQWEWSKDNLSQVAVWIDGNFSTNASLELYTLSDLEPCEEHMITLINTTNSSIIYSSDSVKTFYPQTVLYIVLLLSVGFLLLTFLMKAVFSIIFGALTFLFSMLGFGLVFPYYVSPFSYLFIVIGSLAVIWILGILFTFLSRGQSYE